MKCRFRNILYLLFSVFLICASSLSVAYSYWNIAHDIVSSEATPTKTIEPVCYNDKTGAKFTSVKEALDLATSGQTIYFYIGANATCNENITIAAGVSLVLPFIGQAADSSLTGDNIDGTTKYKIDKAEDRDSYGKTIGDGNEASVKKYRSCLLNMRNGADIVVNGTLSIGGVHTSKGNNGYYSEINLGLNSSITCNSSSTLNCFGYIKENYDDAINSGMEEYKDIIDNSCDKDRYLRVNDGATVNTYIALYDIKEAGGLTGLIAAEQCPFNVFDFQAIQTYTVFEYGAVMKGSAIVVGPNSMSVMKDLTIVSKKSSNSDALLFMESGNLSVEYLPVDARYSSRTTSINNSKIVINGSLEMGYLYLSEFGGQIELDTRLFHLPISSKLSLYVLNGSTFNCNQKVKFLMGSKLIINEGGTFNVNNSVAFYNSAVAPEKNDSLGIYYDSTGKDDALLCCNGTLKLNSDSTNNGYLGAKISHTSTTGNGLLDFKSIANTSYLSAEVKEGTSDTVVIVSSSGKFYDGSTTFDAQFSSGNSYNSANTDSLFYWNGNFVSTNKISVEYDTTVLNPVFDYTITLSENADGSSPFASELTNMKAAGSTSVSNGIYFNLVVNDAASYTVIKNKSETVSCDSNTWIRVDSDFDIRIVPSEGVKVSLECIKDTAYSDNESKWSAGLGHTIFYIKEDTSENGSFSKQTFEQQCSEFTVFIKKCNYFKIGYKWDQSDTIISASGQNGFTANNTITTNDPNFAPQPSTSWNNNSTSSLSGVFQAGNSSTAPGLEYSFKLGYYSGHAASGGGSCLLPDSKVTLYDGSIKLAKDLSPNDELLTYNHFTGKFEKQRLIANVVFEEELHTIIKLKFSNGNIMKLATGHGLFNVTSGKYEIYYGEEFKEHIGEEFVAVNSDGQIHSLEKTTLVSVDISKERVVKLTPVTEYNINCIADGMLNIPDDIEGFFDAFEYGDLSNNLRINQEAFSKYIDLYGVYDYEDVRNVIPEYLFNVLNFKYFKVFIGMGVLSYDKVNYWIDSYAKQMCDYHNIYWDWDNRERLSPSN